MKCKVLLILVLLASPAFGQGNKNTDSNSAARNVTPLVDTTNPADNLVRGSINKPVVVELAPTDPTRLTTEQMLREVTLLRDRVDYIETSNKALMDARFDSMDSAVKLLQDFANRQPTTEAIALEVAALGKLTETDIKGIETRILERDLRVEQTAQQVKQAVDAALQAAKEAVSEQNKSNALAMAKSEAAFTKQIDQQQLLIQANTKASDEKIDDLKNRLTSMEGQDKGGADLWGYIVGVLGIIIAAFSMIAVAFKRTS
jgi:hypothetical protein